MIVSTYLTYNTILSKIKDISDAVASGMEIGVKSYIIKASQNMKMIIKTIENTLKNT